MPDGLSTYTVYYNPQDYPGKWVVRRHEVARGAIIADPEPLVVGNSLGEARDAIPPGLVAMGPGHEDPGAIVEVWI